MSADFADVGACEASVSFIAFVGVLGSLAD